VETFVPPEYTNLFPAKIEAESAFFGEDGLTAVSTFHLDVMILLDLHMPDMGGLDVLARVKALIRH